MDQDASKAKEEDLVNKVPVPDPFNIRCYIAATSAVHENMANHAFIEHEFE